MWIWFIIVFFVCALGVTLGGIIASMRTIPPIIALVTLACSFLFFSYIGMFLAIIGPFGWFGFRLLDIIIAICSFLLIVAILRSYHPAFGYQFFFKPLGLILSILFFLMGFQWGMFNYGTLFTLLMAFFFSGAVFFGILLYNSILIWVKNVYLVAFLPLVTFLFITVVKLL
ncbi:hypothetical protein JCM19045_1180 [Bacillus sp. JCM 19045]|uniref:Uncharacterized protein n=1 Tax=Shouchella xiaoxiensis TaxID=766895 RepID=A0ABS2SRJ5_9BACI|nr:hypothetical protein [Shouchella xiaoxiensis]MBM7838148.1 hypothetical protein [Shouchella xiaoxiensis]GAF12024.1 hypothetical protein JCM19045_1180 [Bacillus sp. JCM 19045]